MEELMTKFPDGVTLPAGRFITSGDIEIPLKYKGQLKVTMSNKPKRKFVEWTCDSKAEYKFSVPVNDCGKFKKEENLRNGKVYILKSEADVYVPFWLQSADNEKEEEMVNNFKKVIEVPIYEKTPEPTPEIPTNTTNNTTPSTSNSMAPLLSAFADMYNLQGRTTTDLYSILFNPESTQLLLEDNEAVQELISYLPPELNSYENLVQAFNSPQVRQSTNHLTQAIYSEYLPTIASLMGLPVSAELNNEHIDPMHRLINCLESSAKNNTSQNTSPQSDNPNNNTEDSQDKSS